MRSRRSAAPHGLTTVLVLLIALCLGLSACGGSPPEANPKPRVPPLPGLVGTYHHYVALGDSYTAAPYVPYTDPDDPCLRSTNNYPSLIAESLAIKDFTDRSCGGAKTQDMTGSQHPGVPPQLDALATSTDLVTLGIGANDMKLAAYLIGTCPALRASDADGSPCRDLMQKDGRDVLLAAIPDIGQEVAEVLREIRERSPKARIVVVGYPRIAPEHGTCSELPLAAGDYAYVNQVTKALDDALEKATRSTHNTWVDTWGPSKGHDVCSDQPWVNGSQNKYGEAAAYHPFEREQVAVTRLVEEALARTNT